MRLFAKWHIWLGWLAGVPLLMWTITGLVMVAKPIEEVRGEHLRVDTARQALPAGDPASIFGDIDISRERPVELRSFMQDGRPVTAAEYGDGRIERYSAKTGRPIAPLDQNGARAVVAKQIIGGDQIVSAVFFAADEVPIDFRRPAPVWRVALKDGTYVYVGRDTGQIEAVRTRWWRIFDTMWGLHIMDLEAREDTSHPVLIGVTALAMLTVLIGIILLFCRRKARASVPGSGSAVD